MRKKIALFFLALSQVLCLSPLVQAASFSDVPESGAHYDAIAYLADYGSLEGYSDSSFKPDASINRAELLKVLVLSFATQPDSTKYRNCYPDVLNDWYAPYVCYATEKGWVEGYSDGLFRPGRSVNKVESVKMLIHAAGLEADLPEASETPFSDTNNTQWYAPYLSLALSLNLLEETSGAFYPAQARTRGEVAENVYRALTGNGTDSLLFGFWGLNGYQSLEGLTDVKSRFNTTVFQVASSNPTWAVGTFLPMIQEAGMKVTFRMTDDHDSVSTNGDFDLDKWKSQVSEWKDSGVQTYIDNGVLVGNMLLDDIKTFSGRNPDAADLDEMARYSESIMPGLMTFVRIQATEIPVPVGGKYLYLDAIVNQYEVKEGPVEAYAAAEYAASQSLGLGEINGLNIADGGDGSSGQAGWRSGRWTMSADEITEYGNVLLDVPDLLMFLMWEYDGQEALSDGSIGSDYFDRSALQTAIQQLGVTAQEY